MFDEVLGTRRECSEKQDLKRRLKGLFEAEYKESTIRVMYLIYKRNCLIEVKGCWEPVGKDVRQFTNSFLLPLFKEYDKSQIILSSLEYDDGNFWVDIQWRD